MSPIGSDDDLLAAELAFGLLGDSERQTAESRLDTDTAFAQTHARWQANAAALFADSGEAPRPSLWGRIEAQLPANDIVPETAAKSAHLWRASALAACAAAIVLGIVALQKPETVRVAVPVVRHATAPMVAVLAGKKGIVTISFDPTTGTVTSAAKGLGIGDHSPQLWVIPKDGKPRSMGVIKASTPSWTEVPAEARSVISAGVTIAVSVEPLGGSPTGAPTGPVILTGKVVPV